MVTRFHPAELQSFLSYMQPTNTTITFETKHVNPIKGKNCSLTDDFCQQVEEKAKRRFPAAWKQSGINKDEPYNISNLATNVLTARVLRELKPQLDEDLITLTNGCCTRAGCPTTIFYMSVLGALKELLA